MGSISNANFSAAVPLEDRFTAFRTSTYTYKVVDDHPIPVDVGISRKLLDRKEDRKVKAPICVRIHGGWLIGGQRNFPYWCPAWIVELALKHNAIFVQPDYRLLPEAKGEDILDDMDDLWAWLGKDLPLALQEYGIEADLDRVFLTGESAGGYLSIQTALTFSKPPSRESPRIRLLVSQFPMLYLRSSWYTQDYHKQIFDAPQFPESIINEHLASIKSATKKPIVTNAPMEETPRRALALALVQHGRFAEVLGEDKDDTPGKRRLHPEDRIADGQKLSPTLFLHGFDDSAVPVDGTDDFVKLLKEMKAIAGLEDGKDEKEVLGYIRVPGDHGFNSDVKLGDEAWTEEAASFIEKHWLE